MMFYGHNRKIMSTLSCYELTELGNIKVKTPCEMALETDREIMNLYEEMFGTDDDIIDPAFLDNWLTSWDFSLLPCLLSLEQILGSSC